MHLMCLFLDHCSLWNDFLLVLVVLVLLVFQCLVWPVLPPASHLHY